MLTNTYNLSGEKCQQYLCEKCDFKCSKKWMLDRHKLTAKHLNTYNLLTNTYTKSAKILYECECGKIYTHRQSLYTHKKKCGCDPQMLADDTIIDNLYEQNKLLLEQNKKLAEQNTVINNDDMLKVFIKENADFKSMILDICKNMQPNNTMINSMNNSNNKTFNLQFFLNETCKDAMNIMDFVDSLKLQLCDLERIGEVGFVTGISDIIIKNLKALDVSKRPVHCADTKREVMYVKDNNKWEKEQDDNKKLKKAIKHIAKKNSMNINLFKEKYPDCINSRSKKSDQFNKIYIEAYGGSGNEDVDNENKIIKNIAKVVFIDKSM